MLGCLLYSRVVHICCSCSGLVWKNLIMNFTMIYTCTDHQHRTQHKNITCLQDISSANFPGSGGKKMLTFLILCVVNLPLSYCILRKMS